MKNRKLVLLMMASLNIVGKAYTQNCFQFTPPLVELIDNSGYLNCIETPTGVYHNNTHHAKSWIAATSIDLSGINPYLPTEFNPYGFQANIVPSAFNVSLVSPADPNSVALWGKLEYGIALPPSIAAEVNNFVNNLPGTKINPYLEWELKVTATFYHGGTTETRDGFYTKDYTATYPSTPPAPSSGSTYSDAEIETALGTWTEIPTSFPFRVRFAPNQTGDWNVQFTVSTPNATYTSPFYDFNVVDVGIAPPIKLSSKKHYFTQGGKTFIPSGLNLGWPEADIPWTAEESLIYQTYLGGNNFNVRSTKMPPYFYQKYRNHLLEAHQDGANFFRFIMSPVSSDIEFEKLGDYTERMTNAYEMDQILFFAEQHQMYIDWNMFLHTVLQVNGMFSFRWDWQTDPNTAEDIAYCYNTVFAQDNSHPINVLSFFTNPDAKKYYKQRLRYIVARWGYSPHVAFFELMSEINNTGKDNTDSTYLAQSIDYDNFPSQYIPAVSSWESEMANYLKNTLQSRQLIAPSYTGKPSLSDPIYSDPNIDVRSYNHYDYTTNSVDFNFYGTGSTDDVLAYTGSPYKPIMYSECAPIKVDACNHVETNRNIWKMQFSGLTLGIDWNQMRAPDNLEIYGKVLQFMQGYDLEIGDVWTPGNIKLHNDGTLEEKNSWKTDMTRKDLKADLTYLRASDQYRAIGVITNRTWNYWTESAGTCGVAPIPNASDLEINSHPDMDVYQTAVDVEYHSNKKIKVRGMKTKKYYIYYYDPANPTVPLDLEYTNDDYQTEWGPELDLEYPRLLTVTRPFVLFKLVVNGNTLPPEFVPNNQGVLAGQTLKRDSLLANSTNSPDSEAPVRDSLPIESVKLYPNPNNGTFVLQLSNNFTSGTISITDILGKEVYKSETREKNTTLHLNLQKGVYYLNFVNENTVQTLQFIVQ